MPAKELVLCQVELTRCVAPLGSTETRLWLSGHAASIYSVNRGESDSGPWHPETRSTKESVRFLRLSTITFIRSSIRWALPRRITTFRTATAKQATRIIEITLKNAK